MNKPTVTHTGHATRGLIEMGLEVNAECYAEESIPSCDEELSRLVQKHGLVALLEALHAASFNAAEVHEGYDDVEDTASLRTRMFGIKIGAALKTLR